MKIHEYQAKELFYKYDIPIPEGHVAFSTLEAVNAADKLGGYPVVVKAQIHAGGRGKGGGVKLADTASVVTAVADEIIGMTLITPQTGSKGRLVKKVLVEQGLNIEKELYLSLIPDRATAKIVIMASEAGGMDIEEVAAKTPDKIIRVEINPLTGIQPYHCREVAFGLKLSPPLIKQLVPMLGKLYRLFVDYDCSLVEINPLVITAEEKIIALDAKLNFDDNALFRHKDILAYRDLDEEDPQEIEAAKYNLNYINLDGNVGNMVNGAGLAMATMDIIKLSGGDPANFLDVGGTANAETVEAGFRIILKDPNVKAILINIFGGIVRCDRVAQGVVDAYHSIGDVRVPVIVRLQGTNAKEAKDLIDKSGLKVYSAISLQEAADLVKEHV